MEYRCALLMTLWVSKRHCQTPATRSRASLETVLETLQNSKPSVSGPRRRSLQCSTKCTTYSASIRRARIRRRLCRICCRLVVDFKYFNNFPVNARYLWVNICHWRSMLGIEGEDLGCFVSELRLGFGASAASNVCQRFAHALAEIFRAAFDKEDETFLQSETNEKRCAYLHQRRHLGPNQCRLYEISIYTDDPFFACVGIDRLVRALQLWHRIMDDIKLELAVVAKRQCGAELSWLGVQFLLTAGAHFITPNKRLRALREVSRIVAAEETVSFAEYRTITSFLQYLKPLVLHLKGDSMYHLYGPYRRRSDGSLPGAGDTIRPNEAAIGCLERWIDVLSGACAAFFFSYAQPAAPRTQTRVHPLVLRRGP